MPQRLIRLFAGFLLGGLMAFPLHADERDTDNASDLPFLKRFEDSYIVRQAEHSAVRYDLPLAAPEGFPPRPDKRKLLKGDWSHRLFALDAGSSARQVFTFYQEQLASRGFELLYECGQDSCGTSSDWAAMLFEPRLMSTKTNQYALSAQGKLLGKDVFVALYVSGGGNLPVMSSIDVIHPRQGKAPPPTVEALWLQLQETGSLVIPDLEFEPGRSRVTSSSREGLELIAEFLKAHPQERFYLIGHSDDTGVRRTNMSLSRQRADAVRKALVHSMNVDPKQLLVDGVGPYAPLVSNQNEKLRENNRRVELVLRAQ